MISDALVHEGNKVTWVLEEVALFCHGIWADGSCFSKVIPALQAEGHECIAAQDSLNTTAGHV